MTRSNGGRAWTEACQVALRQHFAAGLDDDAIGRLLGRTAFAVADQRKKLRLQRPQNRRPMQRIMAAGCARQWSETRGVVR